MEKKMNSCDEAGSCNYYESGGLRDSDRNQSAEPRGVRAVKVINADGEGAASTGLSQCPFQSQTGGEATVETARWREKCGSDTARLQCKSISVNHVLPAPPLGIAPGKELPS
jgi:hypothetical protein